jgi:hypothetical protein
MYRSSRKEIRELRDAAAIAGDASDEYSATV